MTKIVAEVQFRTNFNYLNFLFRMKSKTSAPTALQNSGWIRIKCSVMFWLIGPRNCIQYFFFTMIMFKGDTITRIWKKYLSCMCFVLLNCFLFLYFVCGCCLFCFHCRCLKKCRHGIILDITELHSFTRFSALDLWMTLRVPDQNGISQVCYIVEIYHSGPEPSIWACESEHFCPHFLA